MSATSLGKASDTRPINAQRTAADYSVWRILTIIAAAIAILAYIFYGWTALNLRTAPFPGFLLTYTMTVNAGQPVNPNSWPGLNAGLQRQDFITKIGQPALYSSAEAVEDNATVLKSPANTFQDARQRYNEFIANAEVGQTIRIYFERLERFGNLSPELCDPPVNGTAACSVDLTLSQFPDRDFLVFFLLPFISASIVLLFGLAIIWMRRGRMADMLAATIAFASVVYMAGLFDVGASDRLTPLWILAAGWIGGALVALSLVFPRRLQVINGNPFLQNVVVPHIPLAAFMLGALFIINGYFNPVDPWDNSATQAATLLSIVGMGAMLLIMLNIQRPRAVELVMRDQVNSVLIGLGLMLVPTLLYLANRVFLSQANFLLPLNFEALMVLYIFPNGFLAYAVLQYQRIDTDEVITQGVTYAIMLGVLIFGVFLLSLGSAVLAIDIFSADNALGIAVILLVMVVGFIPLRTRLQNRINRVYFRVRYDYQARAEEFSQALTTLDNYDDIVSLLRRMLDETLAPGAIFVFVRNTDQDAFTAWLTPDTPDAQRTDIRFTIDSALVTLLGASQGAALALPKGEPLPHELYTERARLNLLKARLVAAIRGSSQLSGFVILGPPLSSRPRYDFEEIRFVNALVRQFAIATERAQVINTLERSVRELEVISQIGQAVNFTIGFDEQMELIYTQTNRLIDAPCFYIVLYDQQTQRLYFPFFLEGDDRHEEQENVRWELDDGLISDVVRTGRAIRVQNFAEAMRERNAPLRFITPELRAFMCVPLTAGRGNLFGAMAMGRTSEDLYSDEAFKVFGDIGSLAATSLDKNQLFRQTQIRERQLTVLNDISRQLVATESDVEQLLQIIMSSAVEILNAEAGSLLLFSDERTQGFAHELEFRVVIGGAGESLIGQRIRAGQGVAGQVAQQGQLRIVNDLQHDPAHAQNIGDSERFVARTLIAVPLMAKEGTIGVLQVLNKKDGTFFTQDDADLLTTFAGQAAVAIENARLYSERGVQLDQRVQELELLEGLDKRLNSTFDLHQVAEITVQVAKQYLQAQAGAIGIVQQSPPCLLMVALDGYELEDFPTGSVTEQGEVIWPTDHGVIGRVLRMRRPAPDLVTDTAIDPDYEETLRGSLSQITIPMMAGDEVNAVLVLEKTVEPRFGLADWGFAQRLAEHASIAIANAQFYDQLQNANRNKSEFMGIAAHELKNPLTPIKGYTDILLKGALGQLNEQQEGFIRVIYNNAHRLQLIINDLRDAARQDAGEFTVDVAPMNIRHAVIGALQPFIYQLQDNDQELLNNVPDDLPLVMGDQGRLEQVLTNLVSNASKYSDPGTTITIDAKLLDEYATDNGKRLGPMVRLTVTDQGFGISEEDQKRLFKERYFRSSNTAAHEKPGTGLGMTLTYEIMQRHQGDIWVESEMGQGSSFHIVVPVAQENGAGGGQDAANQPAARHPQPETGA